MQEFEKEKQQLVHLGWTSDIENVHVDALWEALDMKACSPENFMDVSDVKVSDEDCLFVPQHDDQSKEQDGANLDQFGRQRDCVSAIAF